jgi:WD40 repeat protein
VTHEAIIREWSRLRAWLDVSRSDVRMQRNLAALAGEWVSAGNDPSYLLRDARLRQFENWAAESTVVLTADEQTFLQASLQEQAKRQTIEQQRAENERRLEQSARNRLRILVAVMALALLVGIALTGYALNESRRAQVESEISRSLAQAANAERALAEGDADLAIVLALEANQGDNTAPQALRTLTEVAFSPGTRAIIPAHSSFVTAVDIDNQGRYVVSAARDGLVRLWSLADGSPVRDLAGHRGDVQAAVFSPDGRQIASGALDFKAILWDVETGAVLHTLEGHSAAVRAIAFSPDGRLVVTGGRDSDMLVWDTASGSLLERRGEHSATVQALAFSPAGDILASGSGNGEIIFWDTQTWTPIRQLTGSVNGVNDIDFFADGERIVSALADGTLAVWHVASGMIERSIATGALPLSVELVPNELVAFVGLNNGSVLLVDVSSGQTRDLLRGHVGEVYGVALSADGRIGATGAVDTTVRLWNVTNPAEEARYADHRGRITGLALVGASGAIVSASVDQTLHVREGFDQPPRIIPIGAQIRSMSTSSDSAYALLGLANGSVRRVRLADGETEADFPLHNSPVLALSVSGDRAASSAQGSGVSVWNANTGAVEAVLDGFGAAILDVALSRTGNLLAFGADDNSLVLWDAAALREMRRLQGAQTPISSVSISPDASRVAAGTRDGAVFVWNAASGDLLYQLTGHTRDVWSIAFAPDGGSLITAGGDGAILWWDMGTGEAVERFTSAIAPVLKVAIDAGQQYVVSGADRGVMQVWRLYSGDRLIDWARTNRHIRPLTCQERALYRIPPLCEG